MDHLWTPWRYQYISGTHPSPEGCIFCLIPEESDERNLIVHRGEFNYVVLNRFPYTSGHTMVVPFRHFGLFHELTVDEWNEMMVLAQTLQRALQESYTPEGFNIGWNQGKCAGAGVAGHLHLHMVPRWTGDSNMVAVLGETRIIPEDLDTTWRKLRPFFSG